MIHVLVVDDHRLVRQGLIALLANVTDIKVIGEACDGQEAVDLTAQLTPDVVLTDISMPRLDGLKATAIVRARHNHTQVLIVSMNIDTALQQHAETVGAIGYVSKDCGREELTTAIRAVQNGERYFNAPSANRSLFPVW